MARKKKVARRSMLVVPAAEGSARLSIIKKFGDEPVEWTSANVIPRATKPAAELRA